MKYVSYLRVSTDRQGKSGLGIEAQRSAVAAYAQSGWVSVAEIVEVETGTRTDRPELARALALCRLHRCPLVVAKVDRLARSLSFLTRLLDAQVDVRFCDLPQVAGPTGRFLIQQMAAVAELEAGMISTRTKDALRAAKARGVKLGGDRGYRPTEGSSEAARLAQSTKANARALDVQPTIKAMQDRGVMSLAAIAGELTRMGIPTSRGCETWTKAGVARVLKRAEAT